jgi:hypothetical protein
MVKQPDKPLVDAWIKGGGATISAEAVLVELKTGGADSFLQRIVRRKAAALLATKRGIKLTEDQFAEALGEFYATHDVFDPEQIEAWTESLNLEEATIRAYVSEIALADLARTELISENEVQSRFLVDQYDYARADTDVYIFPTAGEAKEFILAVREHEITPAGGIRTHLERREVPEDVSGILFSIEPGELAGPVEDDEGTFRVYLLRHREGAVLDDSIREEIREKIFSEMIDLTMTRDPVKFIA